MNFDFFEHLHFSNHSNIE